MKPTLSLPRTLARTLRLAGATALLAAALPAAALEATWSGFGTIGYARSDSNYSYLGVVDKGGTLRLDSLLAGQVDVKFGPQWSATLQAQVAPADDSDTKWAAKASWAFVAWRPDNDWLVRAGKARVPLYLFSESRDIGVSSDMVRNPIEQYSVSPTQDFTGLFATRSIALGERDLSIDGYLGEATATQRLYFRDGVPGASAAGSFFKRVDVRVAGLVATLRDPEFTWRLGAHSATVGSKDGRPLPVRYPRVDVAPGIGYWQVDNAMPGPGLETTDRIRNLIITAGVDWQLGDGWRATGEFLRIIQHKTEVGADAKAGYLAVSRRIGAFTPYLSWARQRSNDSLLQWREQLTTQQMPAFIPGADMLNAAQRVGGESVLAYDQTSVALGASYALSSTAKIKAEWMQTRIGRASAHFDPPPGQPDAKNLHVNTLSANVSVAF